MLMLGLCLIFPIKLIEYNIRHTKYFLSHTEHQNKQNCIMATHTPTAIINEQMVLDLFTDYTDEEGQVIIMTMAVLREKVSALYSPSTPTTESEVEPSVSVSDGEVEMDGEPKRGKKAKKEKKAKDPDRPKKPNTAFLLFSNDYRSEEKSALEEEHGQPVRNADVSKALGSRWNLISEDEKASYQAKYEALKETYNADIERYYSEYPERKPQKKLVEKKAKKIKSATKSSEKPTTVSSDSASVSPSVLSSLPETPEGWFGPYLGFLKKVPIDAATGEPMSNYTFKTLDEAVAIAMELGDACGGITQNSRGYNLRQATIISSNSVSKKKGELSWSKFKAGDKIVRVAETESTSDAPSVVETELTTDATVIAVDAGDCHNCDDVPNGVCTKMCDNLEEQHDEKRVEAEMEARVRAEMEARVRAEMEAECRAEMEAKVEARMKANEDEEEDDDGEEEGEAMAMEPFHYKGIDYLIDSDDNAYVEEGNEGVVGASVGRRVPDKDIAGRIDYVIVFDNGQ